MDVNRSNAVGVHSCFSRKVLWLPWLKCFSFGVEKWEMGLLAGIRLRALMLGGLNRSRFDR